MLKKAIIVGGSFYHDYLFKACGGKFGEIFDTKIYLPDLYKEDLSSFDYVVISSRLNPKFLMQNANKFLEFINNGGHIVLLGGAEVEFLPHLHYQSSEVNFWWWVHKGADLPLYAFDASHQLWDFCKSHHFKGNLYLTSLDPDFHIGQGFMPITIPFFEKYMRWIESDILGTK